MNTKILFIGALLLAGMVVTPSALAHDGDGKGWGCHSPVNEEVESVCTAVDHATEPVDEFLSQFCTPSQTVSVGPVTVSVDSVCLD